MKASRLAKYAVVMREISKQCRESKTINFTDIFKEHGIRMNEAKLLISMELIVPTSITPSGYKLKSKMSAIQVARKWYEEYRKIYSKKSSVPEVQEPDEDSSAPTLFAAPECNKTITLTPLEVQLLQVVLRQVEDPDLQHFAVRMRDKLAD